MINKKIAVLLPNKTIKDYVDSIIKDIFSEYRSYVLSDTIIGELKEFNAECLFIYSGLQKYVTDKLEDFENKQIIYLSFNDKNKGAENNYHIKLPADKDVFVKAVTGASNIDKLILCVEDNKMILLNLKKMLEKNGFKTESALNGIEGLKKLNEIKPDLIVSDVEMPEMNGLEFCRNVKTTDATKNIPFIFHTTLKTDKDIKTGFSMGADGYIIKPAQEEELISKIKELIK